MQASSIFKLIINLHHFFDFLKFNLIDLLIILYHFFDFVDFLKVYLIAFLIIFFHFFFMGFLKNNLRQYFVKCSLLNLIYYCLPTYFINERNFSKFVNLLIAFLFKYFEIN